MSATPRMLALRIALTARSLGIRPRLLGEALLRLTSHTAPALSDAFLRAIDVAALRSATGLALRRHGDEELSRALLILHGIYLLDIVDPDDEAADPESLLPLPPCQVDDEGCWTVDVAVASSDGIHIDGDFPALGRLHLYRLSAAGVHPLSLCRLPPADEEALLARQLAGCRLLFAAHLDAPAASLAVRAGVHPLLRKVDARIDEELQLLLRRLGQRPSPWLAKGMGQSPAQRSRLGPAAHARAAGLQLVDCR